MLKILVTLGHSRPRSFPQLRYLHLIINCMFRLVTLDLLFIARYISHAISMNDTRLYYTNRSSNSPTMPSESKSLLLEDASPSRATDGVTWPRPYLAQTRLQFPVRATYIAACLSAYAWAPSTWSPLAQSWPYPSRRIPHHLALYTCDSNILRISSFRIPTSSIHLLVRANTFNHSTRTAM